MATVDERSARAILSGCPSLGPARFRRLEEAFGGGAEALSRGPSDWRAVEGIGPALADTLSKELESSLRRWDAESAALEKAGVRVIIPGDAAYPDNLKVLDDRPFVLYMLGEWRPVDALSVALVGSRHPTAYGRAAADRFARELAEAGVTVVSGLARGIDSVVHEAVARKKARTIGVMGSGFGRFYPAENKNLAMKMAERGAVLTEYAWSVGPMPLNFPRRNRLIAGLSLGVVVVEADVKSGALITARLAADQGKEVFAVPGSVFSPMSRGPHRLIKQGARLAEDAEDVLEALEVFRDLLPKRLPAGASARRSSGPLPALVPSEAAVLERVSLEPAGVDVLSASSGLAPGALAAALLNLELKGLVKSLPGKMYVRDGAALSGN